MMARSLLCWQVFIIEYFDSNYHRLNTLPLGP